MIFAAFLCCFIAGLSNGEAGFYGLPLCGPRLQLAGEKHAGFSPESLPNSRPLHLPGPTRTFLPTVGRLLSGCVRKAPTRTAGRTFMAATLRPALCRSKEKSSLLRRVSRFMWPNESGQCAPLGSLWNVLTLTKTSLGKIMWLLLAESARSQSDFRGGNGADHEGRRSWLRRESNFC